MQTKKIIGIFLLIPLLLIFSGCGEANQEARYRVGQLEIWGLFDDNEAYGEIISEYSKINSYLGGVKYKKLTVADYEEYLKEVMISRQEPNIFLIHNTWLPYFKDKIEPVPNNILSESEFRKNFPEAVASDFIDDGKIYAVPLSMDSLALYYNKDIFNAEGIIYPPETWEEFDEYVKKFTKIDQYGNITQSAAAIGTALNINRSTDILSMLMMQNKVQMSDSLGVATFQNPVIVDEKPVKAGENSLEYYTQFARSNSPLYTWNALSHWSIDSFAEGTTVMMLNYSWNLETVKKKNAKLNFAVARVPQMSLEQPANYANYWAFAVAKNKEAIEKHEAWQFLKFLTTKNNGSFRLVNGRSGTIRNVKTDIDPAKSYIDKKNVPAARLDIINGQQNEHILGPFAYGNLIAKSWRQIKPEENEKILAEAISSVNKGSSTITNALNIAVNRINQLGKK